MNSVMLSLLGIIGLLITLSVLYSIWSAFLKEFEKSCHESIKKRDKEFEEKLNKELRKWLFGGK